MIAANERADAFVLFRERLICVLKLEQKRRYRCKVRIGIWMHIYEFAFDCTEAEKSEAALALDTCVIRLATGAQSTESNAIATDPDSALKQARRGRQMSPPNVRFRV